MIFIHCHKGESQHSTLKNGQPVASGALMVGERSTLPLAASSNPPLLNSFNSGNNGSIPVASKVVGDSSPLTTEGQQQLMNQQYYQEHIQRLERELEAVRRQASKQNDVSFFA